MKTKIIIAAIIVTCISVLPVCAFDINRTSRIPPAPRLMYPVTDNIDLSSKPVVEFRWIGYDTMWIDHYEFRLYKGYQTYADNLIMKKEIPSAESTLAIGADTFEVGQVYTWSLAQVATDGTKGDRSFSPFIIINK